MVQRLSSERFCPQVFTDVKAKLSAPPGDHMLPCGRLKMTPFIKHVIGGEQRLVDGGHKVAAVVNERSIEQPFATTRGVRSHSSKDDAHILGCLCGHMGARLARLTKERGVLEQVLGRIADNPQFGEHGQVGAARTRPMRE